MRKDIHNSEIPVICRACEARHRGVCGALSVEELVVVAKQARQVSHKAGTELIGESETISSFANVMKGVVKLSKMLEDGRQQVVGLQFAPDFLGRPFSSESNITAEAASDIELCQFPRSSLEVMMADNPGFERKFLEQTLRELDEAREWMVALGRKTAAEKVASFLYSIAMHIHPIKEESDANSVTFDLPLTRADIADFLGLTVETVSRQITKLRTEKIVEVTSNRHITIPDLKRLKSRGG